MIGETLAILEALALLIALSVTQITEPFIMWCSIAFDVLLMGIAWLIGRYW